MTESSISDNDNIESKEIVKQLMSASGKIWSLKEPDERHVLTLQSQKNISVVLATLLAARRIDVDGVDAYIDPRLRHHFPDPFALLDMEKAVMRVMDAIKQRQKMIIIGDYDVDGTTSTSLLLLYLRAIGYDHVDYIIPDRMKDGYGPQSHMMQTAAKNDVSLVITLDCGTMAFEPIETAKNLGLDVIVIDHHQGEASMPPADAIVNPNRLDEDSDLTYLAAVGVTFLFICALQSRLRDQTPQIHKGNSLPDLMSFLNLVALGTICDIVPLVGLNRAFVAQGIKVLRMEHNIGLKTLGRVARIQNEIDTYHCGFVFGPRINAGGRIGESFLGTELLISNDPNKCQEIAEKLDVYNLKRQEIEKETVIEALDQIEEYKIKNHQKLPSVLCVYSDSWHPGVIGIVASRIVEKYHRPTVVVAVKDGIGKASCRSIKGFDVGHAILDAYKDGLLINGGGHEMAGGFSVDMTYYDALVSAMNKLFMDKVGQEFIAPVMKLDLEAYLSMLDRDYYNDMQKCAPFGMQNAEPKIMIKGVYVGKAKIVGEKHISFFVTDGHKKSIKAICFNAVGGPLEPFLLAPAGQKYDLCASLKENIWNEYVSLQLHVNDIRSHS